MSITASASSPAVSATVSGGAISASAQAGGVAVSVSAPSPVQASAAGGTVSAEVTGSSVNADVMGGIGPSGLPNLSQALDVQLSSVTDGDVLRYSSSKWRNYAETGLVDGGNW